MFLAARPRIISDKGPQFVSRALRKFILVSAMSHFRTSPYYPQADVKLERFNRTSKRRVYTSSGSALAGSCQEHRH